MSTLAERVPSNAQARWTMEPVDDDGDPVILDPGAIAVTVVSGNGTFGYNADTNGLVFIPEDDATGEPVTLYALNTDGQPGPKVRNFPSEVTITAIAPVEDPEAAETLNAGIALEAKGTPP